MKKALTILCAIIVSVFLGGCANDFAKFYQDKTVGVPPDILARRLQPYSGTTQIFSTQDPQKDAEQAMRRGYILLGVSSFQGSSRVTQDMLMNQAQAVGADMVLYRSQYQGSEQVAMPFMSYQPGQTATTYSSGTMNANAYGSSGYAQGTGNYSGTSTTTTPGTYSTTVVPVTRHNYAHEASFWRKGKQPVFGVNVANIPDDLRRSMQRNTGALVKTVKDDSPAFRANILPGDILVGIDDVSIDSARDLLDKMPQFAGKKCKVYLLRDGTAMIIPVQMNNQSN